MVGCHIKCCCDRLSCVVVFIVFIVGHFGTRGEEAAGGRLDALRVKDLEKDAVKVAAEADEFGVVERADFA